MCLGCLHIRGGVDFSPPGILLLMFVNCKDSGLRLPGSDSYLAEVFPHYQCRHQRNHLSQNYLCLLHCPVIHVNAKIIGRFGADIRNALNSNPAKNGISMSDSHTMVGVA
ncbi:hypothetical protein C4A43_03351 [Escherichia coli]|nr:hypothetical protein C4A43_03351 [Escherichia coli]